MTVVFQTWSSSNAALATVNAGGTLDTPGWSHAVLSGGNTVYLQATAENLAYYVRVIPNWAATMKRAVDEAK